MHQLDILGFKNWLHMIQFEIIQCAYTLCTVTPFYHQLNSSDGEKFVQRGQLLLIENVGILVRIDEILQ